MNLNVTSYSPDCNVIFFPYNKEITYDQVNGVPLIQANDPDAIAVTQISAQPDIIQCSTTKSKGGTGTFTVVLSSRLNYKSLLEPGCWCMIYMRGNPLTGNENNETDSGFKMLGQVKSVRRKEMTNPQTGARTVRFLVSGEDFQCLLNTPIYLNADLSQFSTDTGNSALTYSELLLDSKLRTPLSPDKLVATLLQNLLGSTGFTGVSAGSRSTNPIFFSGRFGTPMKIPSEVANKILGESATGNSYTALLTLFFTSGLIGISAFTNTISGQVGIWDLLQSYQNRVLNELYTELIPATVNDVERLVPSIIFRPQPYNSLGLKNKLAANADKILATLQASGQSGNHVSATRKKNNNAAIPVSNVTAPLAHFYVSKRITEDQIMGLDSGKHDKELHNFVFMTPNTGNALDPLVENAYLQFIARGNISAIADLASVGRHGQRPFINYTNYFINSQEIIVANQIIRDMWINAHVYENGTVMLIGTNEYIPVGTNIEFTDRGWVGHVEKVDNVFSIQEGTGTKSFRTNISFVRLQNFDGTPVDPVDHSTFNSPIAGPWDRGASSL